jgi:hypothetical protein
MTLRASPDPEALPHLGPRCSPLWGEGWRSTLKLSCAAKVDVLACSLFASSGSDGPVTAEGVEMGTVRPSGRLG